MALADFIKYNLIKTIKNPVGFDEQVQYTHLSLNLKPDYHYFGTAAYNDSISMQVPLFHPYNPGESCLPGTVGLPSTPIALECPVECKENLPLNIKNLLQEHKATKIHIRPFIQNMPWDNNLPLLIRPNHLLLYPTTPEQKLQFINGSYSGACHCRVAIFPPREEKQTTEGIFSLKANIKDEGKFKIPLSFVIEGIQHDVPVNNTENKVNNSQINNTNVNNTVENKQVNNPILPKFEVTLVGTAVGTLSPVLNFTSHASGTGYTLCSPSNGAMTGINYSTTTTFYVVIVTSPNGSITPDSEWYISPVSLLNVTDFDKLLQLTGSVNINTVFDLIIGLEREGFALGKDLAILLGVK
jgi:hypothetical protein